MAKFIDQSQLRGMHGRTLLQAQKHFGHAGTNNREAYGHAYKASEKHNNHYNNLSENKEGHAEHTSQAAKLRAAGDEKGAKIHEELASHYHRAQGIEVPKKARAPRVTKDPLVQASKGRASASKHEEAPEAPKPGHKAAKPEHTKTKDDGSLSAAAHAASKVAEAEGTRENHDAARKAHYRAAQESMKADPTGSAEHSRLSNQHAHKVDDLIREAKRGSRYKRPASAVPTQAGSVAAGTHVRTNMAGEASKLAQNKALMGGDPEPAKPKKPRAPRKSKDPLVQAAKAVAPAAEGGGDKSKPILTDAKGKPFEKPTRKEGESAVDFGRRVHAHNDAVTATANKGFDEGLKKGLRGGPDAGSARETSDRRIRSLIGNDEDKRNTPAFRDAVHERQLLDSRDKGAKAQSAALSGRVAGAKERLTASRERVAGMGKPAAPPTAAATHAAETQAKQTALTAAHGEELGKLHGAYSALAQHHEISARTASDGATKASHTNLAAHYGNARDTLKHADAAGRFKDSATAERDHAGHADAHRFAAKGASHPSIAGLHSKLAAHHDELHAHHLANKHGIGVEDARKAIGEAGESMRRGGIRSRGEAHNYQTGKKGGWYYTSKRGVKVYVGKGHR